MGICNVFSRVGNTAAPYLAELKPETISEWTFVGACGIAIVASFNLRSVKKLDQKLLERVEKFKNN
jgi:hypothetical protein